MNKQNKILLIGKKFLILISLFGIFTISLYADNQKVRIDKKSIEDFLYKYYDICENAKDDEETGSYDKKSMEEMSKLFEFDIDYSDKVITACKNSILAYQKEGVKGVVKIIGIEYRKVDDYYLVTYNYVRPNMKWTKSLVYMKDSNGKMSWFFET